MKNMTDRWKWYCEMPRPAVPADAGANRRRYRSDLAPTGFNDAAIAGERG